MSRLEFLSSQSLEQSESGTNFVTPWCIEGSEGEIAVFEKHF
jgi:hypothetical protein